MRERGCATLDQESEIGLGSIASALRDDDGKPAVIIGFSGPVERLDYPALLAHLKDGGDALREQRPPETGYANA